MKIEKFRLIDRVVDFNSAEKTITCDATVPLQSSIFEGHFPGYPLMPGVLLLECMAQTSGWMILILEKFRRMAFLAAARDAKFRTFVAPGEKLDVSAKVVHDGSGFAVTSAKVETKGKIVCDATIMFRVVDFPNEDMRQSMLTIASETGLPAELIPND